MYLTKLNDSCAGYRQVKGVSMATIHGPDWL